MEKIASKNENRSVKVFDFDKTLTTKDTTLSIATHEQLGLKWFSIVVLYLVLAVSEKMGFIEKETVKNALFGWAYHRKTEVEVNRIWSSFAREFNAYNHLYNQIDWTDNSLKFILTAQIQGAIEPMFKGKARVVGSQLERTIEGRWQIKYHCYGHEKQKAWANESGSEIDEFYSDSISDQSLANCSKHAFWVTKTSIRNWPNKEINPST
jgi:hypothetical protein